MQERVSRSIVEALKLKLTPQEDRYISARPFEDFHAYECYLRARREIMLFTKSGLDKARGYLQQALDIVGENATLLAGMGYVYWMYVNLGLKPPAQYLPKAVSYAERVFDLEPDSPRGHFVLGVVDTTSGKPQDAVTHLKKSLRANPNDPDTLLWLVIVCGSVGRTSLAREYAARLIEVDPLTPVNHASLGFGDLCDGRFDLSLDKEKRWFEMEDTPVSRFWYGWVLAHTGEREGAIPIFEGAVEREPENLWSQLGLCFKSAFRGDAAALADAAASIWPAAEWDQEYAWFLSECYALIGDKNTSLDWLEKSVENGFINYPLISRLDKFLDNIRGEERFDRLVASVKRDWEWFEA